MANGFLQFSALILLRRLFLLAARHRVQAPSALAQHRRFRFQFSVLLKVKEARIFEPLLLLVDKVILFAAEAWEHRADATRNRLAYIVATLGYNLENIYLRSSVAQNISFHNAFEI